MDAGVSTARETRTGHRHELRTLTYLALDQANGGVIRNLSQSGMGTQLVMPLRTGDHIRLRFDLRNPKLRIQTLGKVIWTKGNGQCGIQFLDLPHAMRQQINEWIFSDLLENAWLHAERSGSMFSCRPVDVTEVVHEVEGPSADGIEEEEEDGLLISGTAAKVIPLPIRLNAVPLQETTPVDIPEQPSTLDWLSQPLSLRSTAALIDALAVIAAYLLFALIFLSLTGETPPSPFLMAIGGLVLVILVYWTFFWVFGGESLGTRLARKAGLESEREAED